MPRNTRQFYAIINKNGFDKEEVVYRFTDGRTTSLTELSDKEFYGLMQWLQKFNQFPAGDQMRKKMIALAKQMNWGTTTFDILRRIDGWLVKQKFQLPLMKLDVQQLALMLAVFEQRVYRDYLRDLNK